MIKKCGLLNPVPQLPHFSILELEKKQNLQTFVEQFLFHYQVLLTELKLCYKRCGYKDKLAFNRLFHDIESLSIADRDVSTFRLLYC